MNMWFSQLAYDIDLIAEWPTLIRQDRSLPGIIERIS